MKFDPINWHEVKPNETYESPKGVLRVRCSAPSPLYIEAHGVEALAGVETSFEVETSDPVVWRIDAAKSVRVFILQPAQTAVKASGEVYTNIDRMADESGSLNEVKKAMRQFEIERRAALREIRAESAALSFRKKASAAGEDIAPKLIEEPALALDPKPDAAPK